MGTSPSNHKVARAARAGGGRTGPRQSPATWTAVVVALSLIGFAVIYFSKQGQRTGTSGPRLGDHWHAAIGFNICGEFVPPITNQNDPLGIHTHGDGVVHVHPHSATAVGERATLGKFFDAVGAEVTESMIDLPGEAPKREGMRCGDQRSEVRTKVWSSRAPDAEFRTVFGDPADIRFTQDGQLITVALLPPDAEIPPPPSADQLDQLTDVPPAPSETGASSP